MTRRPPQLHVHVERVVLHGVEPMEPGALAGAIQAALAESLAGTAAPPRAPLPPAAHVGQAVAPAVLGAIGLDRGTR